MTTLTALEVKRQILASKTSRVRSLNLEKALEYDLNIFFQHLKEQVLHELAEYWPEDNEGVLLQGQLDLILAPIFESQQEYYNILRKYNIKEYNAGVRQGRRLVNLARKPLSAFKSEDTTIKPQNLLSTSIDKDELFGTNDWTEQKLLNQSFTASERTMNRVDQDINKLLSDGYASGKGIKPVAATIEKRFDQLRTWEARRIARTEIHNAHQMGIMNTYYEMGVQYTQWVSAHDGRTRDSHKKLNGEIIPLGGTFSNDCQFPGDTKGPLKEWINCRCGNVPFIIPDGYIAPPGMAQFREKDLVQTLDYWNQDDLIKQATQEANVSQISERNVLNELKRTNEFDIYRLPPDQREHYLKLKKNHYLLKEALETKNYNKLDELDHSVATMIESKATVKELGDDFLTLAKEELEDYKLDIKDYEKIIKDKNIKVTIKPKVIDDWKNDELKNMYHVYNPKTKKWEDVNLNEKFIKYTFEKENLTIYESVDIGNSRVMHVYEEYKKLPKKLRNTNEIVLSSQKPISKIDITMKYEGYVVEGEGNRIVQFQKTLNETIDNLIHEATHNIEKDHLHYISNSKEYVLAFKKDQQRLLAQGKELKETYVTDYAYSFTEAALKPGSKANSEFGHRIYSEDLAESMKKYLRNKTKFEKDYPEKAKVLEKILNGGFKPETTTPYKEWFKVERKRFRLTPIERERQLELKVKQTDLAIEGKKLSSKELKELQYYEDKTTFDYLYYKKITGGLFDKSEEKAFNDISKKWKKKLKITNEVLNEKSKTIKTNFTKYTTKDNKYSIKVREVTDKREFMECLEAARDSQPIHARWRVEIPEKLSRYDNCKMFVTEHGSTVAIDEHGDIISVCAKIPKSQKKSKDSSRALLEFAVKNGGTKLDSYDGNYWFYRKCGFEPISYCEFVEDFAPDDWKKWHAFNSKEFKKENIIFFKHTGKQSKYVDENEFYDNVDVSKDYDDAEHIRDKQFTRINKVKSWLKNIR